MCYLCLHFNFTHTLVTIIVHKHIISFYANWISSNENVFDDRISCCCSRVRYIFLAQLQRLLFSRFSFSIFFFVFFFYWWTRIANRLSPAIAFLIRVETKIRHHTWADKSFFMDRYSSYITDYLRQTVSNSASIVIIVERGGYHTANCDMKYKSISWIKSFKEHFGEGSRNLVEVYTKLFLFL